VLGHRLHESLAVFSFGLYAAPSYLAEHGEPLDSEDLARHAAIRMLQANAEAAAWTLLQGEQRWHGIPPGWHLPSVTAWAVFPERKLMPIKTRVFIDMLQTALAKVQA